MQMFGSFIFDHIKLSNQEVGKCLLRIQRSHEAGEKWNDL